MWTSKSSVAVACFLPGRAKDLSALLYSFLRNMKHSQSFVEPKKHVLPYNVNEMTREDFFFYLKALSGSLGSSFFSKTTVKGTVKMTDIKTVKVDKRSPYTFSFKTSYSQENYRKVVLNNRRKTKSVAAQLDLQPACSKKLPIGDKKKTDILDLLRKKSYSQVGKWGARWRSC